MPERTPSGLLDTCVLIDYLSIPAGQLPIESMVSAISLAELSVGIQYATDPVQRSLRVNRLLMVQANMTALPFTEDAAQVFGHLNALVLAAGRNPRPRRMDLLIAATAVTAGVPLYTRNVDDFKGLESQLTVVPV